MGGPGRLGSAMDAILAPVQPCELAEKGKAGVKIGAIATLKAKICEAMRCR